MVARQCRRRDQFAPFNNNVGDRVIFFSIQQLQNTESAMAGLAFIS